MLGSSALANLVMNNAILQFLLKPHPYLLPKPLLILVYVSDWAVILSDFVGDFLLLSNVVCHI